jgi:hypothetical protein
MEHFMKLKNYVGSVMLILVLFSNAFAEKPEEKNRPEAYFPENTFIFDKILEGTDVTHDFVIKNKGNAPLTVEKVKST